MSFYFIYFVVVHIDLKLTLNALHSYKNRYTKTKEAQQELTFENYMTIMLYVI